MGCWPKWRPSTIAVRGRASRLSRSAGIRSSMRSIIIAWTCRMRCRCASRRWSCSRRSSRCMRLPPEYREWLSAAAMLYEVGSFLNRNGRHRHTHYIISNSEILGYTTDQRRIISAIARYLGKSRPTPGDGPMKGLSTAEQQHIAKASLLLRLARAMNLGRGKAAAQCASVGARRSGQAHAWRFRPPRRRT